MIWTSPCPNFKAAGMQLRLHAHLGSGGGRHTRQGPAKLPGPRRPRSPRKLSDSGNLMDGSGASSSPHIQEPPQSGQSFLLLVGSRPEREARRRRGPDRNPGQC